MMMTWCSSSSSFLVDVGIDVVILTGFTTMTKSRNPLSALTNEWYRH